MTNEKALDILSNLIGMVEGSNGNDYDAAIKIAVEAIEKNTPKKPSKRSVDLYNDKEDTVECITIATCPSCGFDLADHGMGFVCVNSNCRQAIKFW